MGFFSTSPFHPLRGNLDRAPDETTGWSIAKKMRCPRRLHGRSVK